MSARTKTRRIKRPSSARKKEKERLIPWKDAFKEEIEKYTEAGLSLRGSRLKEGLTQKELGDTLGVSQNHISEMENGKRTIGKEMAKRFATFFKTDYRIFL
jgi:DNA-binding XRE family transcriptional regulator